MDGLYRKPFVKLGMLFASYRIHNIYNDSSNNKAQLYNHHHKVCAVSVFSFISNLLSPINTNFYVVI